MFVRVKRVTAGKRFLFQARWATYLFSAVQRVSILFGSGALLLGCATTGVIEGVIYDSQGSTDPQKMPPLPNVLISVSRDSTDATASLCTAFSGDDGKFRCVSEKRIKTNRSYYVEFKKGGFKPASCTIEFRGDPIEYMMVDDFDPEVPGPMPSTGKRNNPISNPGTPKQGN